ncbi:MAG: OmpH family outer membrane protein [Bacteroidia bacterium]|jgi:outer membrane protein
MKNINLIFNVVLTMAVAVLFALHFSGDTSNTNTAEAVAKASSDLRIAYFNSDSIRTQYAMFTVEKEKMEAEMKQAEDRLIAEQKKFQADVSEFQQRAEFLTITERESRAKKLGQKEQELMQLEQSLSAQLAEKEAGVNKQIFTNVENFLKDYAKKNAFTYVVSYMPGGQIWYTNPALDITADMVKHLNEEYEKTKTAGE